jgi:hypothetical protein
MEVVGRAFRDLTTNMKAKPEALPLPRHWTIETRIGSHGRSLEARADKFDCHLRIDEGKLDAERKRKRNVQGRAN